jgi:hypothetical protein
MPVSKHRRNGRTRPQKYHGLDIMRFLRVSRKFLGLINRSIPAETALYEEASRLGWSIAGTVKYLEEFQNA